MNRFIVSCVIGFVVGVGRGEAAHAGMITGFFDPVAENFNSYEGTTATIPNGFAFSGIGEIFRGFYDSTSSYANLNGHRALHANDSAEIALGMRKTANVGPTLLSWTLTNETGTVVNTLEVSWDVKQFSAGGRASTIGFNYDAGSGFTTAGINGLTLTTASISDLAGNFSSPTVTNRSVIIELVNPVAQGDAIILGWEFSNGVGSGSNSHIGVDNLSVTAVTAVPEPASFLLVGIAAVAGLAGQRWKRRTRRVGVALHQ